MNRMPDRPPRATRAASSPRVRVALLAAAAWWAGPAAGAVAQDGVETDRAALEALYDAAVGPGWTESANWRTPAPLGEWHGVRTDGAGRVTGLFLAGNGLAGSLPPDLEPGSLANLGSLFLRDNDLGGPLPAWLGSLADLRFLDLGHNRLSGALPAWLGSLGGLELLSLRGNELAGPIPEALGGLASLTSLAVAENYLTGPVPGELGSLASLESLDLSTNPLSGVLPRRLTRLSRLTRLNVGSTDACAPADAEFQAWLAGIDFSGVTCNRPPRPVGVVPGQALTEFGVAVRVSTDGYFDDPDGDALAYAAVSSRAGTVTAHLAGADVWLLPGAAGTATVTVTARDPDGESAAQAIAVTNATSGPAIDREALEAFYDATGGPGWTESAGWKTPAPLGEWHGVTTDAAGRVTELNLVENGLAGPVPLALVHLENLRRLDLPWNDLIGPLPDALGSLADLSWLDLAWNGLSGAIPARLGDLTSLRWLRLDGNPFTGGIPPELGRLANLEALRLSRIGLSGPVPASLGDLVRLEDLVLTSNALSGPIPGELGGLANLELLGLSGNTLSGPIPAKLGGLANLEYLILAANALTGPIPGALGNLSRLSHLDLSENALTGRIPDELGNLANLSTLRVSHNWGLSGPLPAGLRRSPLETLDTWITRACAPADWEDRLPAIEFRGLVCGSDPDVTIDVAVVYTPAVREAAGGADATRAMIDLWVAESNQAYAASGMRQRIALAARSEVDYVETGVAADDVEALANPSDGRMDGVHALRDRSGADLAHLIVARSDVCGIARLGGSFGLTDLTCGAMTFTHELGHNSGLLHDRGSPGGDGLHPAYGYVNPRGLVPGASPSRRWHTVMAYSGQCLDFRVHCPRLHRFSNPRQRHDGDPLGVPFRAGESGVSGPADAAAVLDATAAVVAARRDRPAGVNRPPVAVGALPDRTLRPGARLDVDVSRAFVDPDGDALAYGVSSSAPRVAAVGAAGARVTVTAVGEGVAAIRVTATDPGGLSASHAFTVTVSSTGPIPFTDDPLVPGATPVRAVHFTELRSRIDGLRQSAGLGRFAWTDPRPTPGMTPVRLAHLLELREALAAAYAASGRTRPRWSDPSPAPGVTPIRAAHVTELRAAVVALE